MTAHFMIIPIVLSGLLAAYFIRQTSKGDPKLARDAILFYVVVAFLVAVGSLVVIAI